MTSTHDPLAQIALKNAWYTDDQFAKQYAHPGARDVINNRWLLFEKILQSNFQSVLQTTPLRILDAGCGDGINLLGLSKISEKLSLRIELFGADYNPLRVQRSATLPFVQEVIKSSLTALPYPEGSFDAILCNHVLEHIREDESVLQELRRVLQPGGILILGVPNEGCILAWLRNHVMQRSILKTTDHVNFYTGLSISKKVVKLRFDLVSLETAGFFLPHFFLQYFVSSFKIGRLFLKAMGKVWKSQSAEVILVVQKKRS